MCISKHLLKVLTFGPILFSTFILSSCSDSVSIEDQLRNTIKDIELAVEQRDISEFMTHVSEQYIDDQSRSRNDIKQIAQLYLLRNRNLHVFKHITQLQISENEGQAIILVAVSGQPIESKESLSETRAELMRFKVNFKFDEQWKLYSARWNRASLVDFF